jgi:hypothetical protein
MARANSHLTDVSAEDIQAWAGRPEAFMDLPLLVDRLLKATPGILSRFRGGGGTRLPGWDGVVRIPAIVNAAIASS